MRRSGRLMDALVTQDNTYRIGWFVILKRLFHGRIGSYIRMRWRAYSAQHENHSGVHGSNIVSVLQHYSAKNETFLLDVY